MRQGKIIPLCDKCPGKRNTKKKAADDISISCHHVYSKNREKADNQSYKRKNSQRSPREIPFFPK